MDARFYKLSKISILLLFLLWTTEKNAIQKIDSLEQVANILETADRNSLVIFDIDDTLISPADTIEQTWFHHSPDGQKVYKELDAYIKTKDNPRQYSEMMTEKIKSKTKFKLIEDESLQLIHKLQNKNVKVMALTNCSTGPGKIIDSWQSWRSDNLKQVGIDFSSSFDLQAIDLSKFIKSGDKPVFYKGILLTDGVEKGVVLGAFLDAINFVADQIFFFDDQENQVKSVEKMAIARGIPYQGFIFRGAEKLVHIFDPAVIQLQLQYIKNDDYITEVQASELLKK